jgi:hypothetical protein
MRTFSKNYTTIFANAKQVVLSFVKQFNSFISALGNPQKPTKHLIFFSPGKQAGNPMSYFKENVKYVLHSSTENTSKKDLATRKHLKKLKSTVKYTP